VEKIFAHGPLVGHLPEEITMAANSSTSIQAPANRM
jgi:hypothetical protein